MSQTPVTLTRLCRPSRTVVKQLNDEFIDEILATVLKRLCVIVLHGLPTFISYHPGVVGTYVNLPTVPGAVKAMMTTASSLPSGRFLEIIQKEVSIKEKLSLRSFLANVRPSDVVKEGYSAFLCSLPIFETLFKRFVSKNDGLSAARVKALPVAPLHDLIDISNDDSRILAQLLKIRILQPIDVLCKMIFPDINEGHYNDEQIDKVMFYVLGCFTHTILQNDSFKRQVQALSFVPKKRERVRASGVFDPRNYTLKRIFAQEDVFPVGEMYNEPTTLVILEKLGMKNESNVTARDLFHSANQISRLSQHQTAIQKSKAILHNFLNTHPKMLRETVDGKELGLLLMKIQWLTRLRQKASRFPPSLALWKTKEGYECFFKPTELKSPALVNLVGTVKPVVELEPLNEVSEYFGWQKLSFSDVALQLRNVIHFYSKDEKPYNMVILNEIYSFLSRGNYQTLTDAFQRAGIVNWVWNGDGFSSPDQMLSSKPRIDLAPYIRPLPSELKRFIHLFGCFGVKSQSDSTILLQVLHAIKKSMTLDCRHCQILKYITTYSYLLAY